MFLGKEGRMFLWVRNFGKFQSSSDSHNSELVQEWCQELKWSFLREAACAKFELGWKRFWLNNFDDCDEGWIQFRNWQLPDSPIFLLHTTVVEETKNVSDSHLHLMEWRAATDELWDWIWLDGGRWGINCRYVRDWIQKKGRAMEPERMVQELLSRNSSGWRVCLT